MAMLRDSATAIEKFRYPLSGVAGPSVWQQLVSDDVDSEIQSHSEAPSAASPVDDRADEVAGAFEHGRREGIEEGRRIERLELAVRTEQIEKQREEQVRLLCEQYTRERDDILRAIEPEVVTLALRVAERIILREVQIDPLLLTGAVRAALGQLADKSKARVCVPQADADLWSESLAHLANLRCEPEVKADAQLRPGECRIECEYGTADLSVETQLRGIRRSFLDEEGASLEYGSERERLTPEEDS